MRVARLQDVSSGYAKPAVYAPALGRPLAWDRYGAYALDAQGPLSKEDTEIVEQTMLGELGRAEVRARARMAKASDDFVPPWIVGQIHRRKGMAYEVYLREVKDRVDAPGSPAVLFYRYEVCRIGREERLVSSHSRDQETFRRMEGEMGRLRARLLPASTKSLGLTIGLTQSGMWTMGVDPKVVAPWGPVNRAVLEAYRTANPRGVDVRPLLCRAYSTGVIYGLATAADGHRERLHLLDEPQPKKALAIALSILKDRPNDPLGHFSAGRSYVGMGLPKSARREMQAALDTGGLPMYYERAARRYLETGDESAFSAEVPY